ncbi:MAG: phosphoglycerate mutase family protein [Candidatus Paceibacterota bacterium]|jgi:phosphohistidine phosphatase SixA
MKDIVAARHCAYDGDPELKTDRLSEYGREQAWALAEELKEVVGEYPVTIVSSTANRAVETAQILEEVLHAKLETSDVLNQDVTRHFNYGRVKEILDAKEKEGAVILILVTHKPFAKSIATYFWRMTAFSTVEDIQDLDLEPGQAIVMANGQQTKILRPPI